MIANKELLNKYVIIVKEPDYDNPGYYFYKTYSKAGNMFDLSLGIGLYDSYKDAEAILQLGFDAAYYILSMYKELHKYKSDLVKNVTPGDFNANIRDTLIVSDLAYHMSQTALDDDGSDIVDDSYSYIIQHMDVHIVKLSEVISKFVIYDYGDRIVAQPSMDGIRYKSYKD